MNKVYLTGRVVKDGEILKVNDVPRGIKFFLAVERRYRGKDGEKNSDFVPITFFTPACEKLISYITKGKLMSLSGSLRIYSYTTKEGEKKFFTDVFAEEVQFLGGTHKKNEELAEG